MTIQIHATLGPASRSESVIEDLLLAGAHVFRLNLSHCAPQDVPHWVERIRRCSRSVHRPAMIAPDIRGRKLRLGPLCDDQATLAMGQTYLLHCVTEGQELPGDNRSAWVNHPLLAATVAVGNTVLLHDGALRLRVTAAEAQTITCEVEVGGLLPGRSGLNIPGLPVALPPLGSKDLADLDTIASLGVDWVYLSYVESGDDIDALRHALAERACALPIIAKIERRVALAHVPEIAARADGVCLARGDLGVEIPLWDIPFVQREVLARTHAAGKPFILAGEVLYSMIGRQIPARAELTDVAVAVEQGVDGFILSDETAMGIAPVAAVRTLVSLINGTARRLSQEA